MSEQNFNKSKIRLIVALGIFVMVMVSACTEPNTKKAKKSAGEAKVDQTNTGTELIKGEGLDLVIANCTACHSAKLIVQNRATREGWEGMIRWMQATQNLWPLGKNEEIILDYLAKNYAPDKKGRRENLKDITWYKLKLDD